MQKTTKLVLFIVCLFGSVAHAKIAYIGGLFGYSTQLVSSFSSGIIGYGLQGSFLPLPFLELGADFTYTNTTPSGVSSISSYSIGSSYWDLDFKINYFISLFHPNLEFFIGPMFGLGSFSAWIGSFSYSYNSWNAGLNLGAYYFVLPFLSLGLDGRFCYINPPTTGALSYGLIQVLANFRVWF